VITLTDVRILIGWSTKESEKLLGWDEHSIGLQLVDFTLRHKEKIISAEPYYPAAWPVGQQCYFSEATGGDWRGDWRRYRLQEVKEVAYSKIYWPIAPVVDNRFKSKDVSRLPNLSHMLAIKSWIKALGLKKDKTLVVNCKIRKNIFKSITISQRWQLNNIATLLNSNSENNLPFIESRRFSPPGMSNVRFKIIVYFNNQHQNGFNDYVSIYLHCRSSNGLKIQCELSILDWKNSPFIKGGDYCILLI